MPLMTWNVWKRSEGCRNWMDKTKFGDTSFTAIFYDAMRMVFYDENNKPGLLPRGLVFAASQKVVIANGRRYGFSQHDQEVLLKSGIVKYNSSNWWGDDRLEIQGPEQDKLNAAGNMAQAPHNGEYIYLHFYNLIRMAQEGSGMFKEFGPLVSNSDGRRALSAVTGAVVFHEIMHNHGFKHPKVVNWDPGSDYASSLPHVAMRSVLDAARSEFGSSSMPLTKVRPPSCGTDDGTQGAGAPAPPPTPPPPPPVPLYNAVLEKGEGRYMLRGWAQNDLEVDTIKKGGLGYRLSDQVRYEIAPGQPRYDAIFRPAAGQHKAIWNYDLGSLQTFDAHMRTKGLIMLHQLSYPTSQGRRYDALFASRPGERRLIWGWTRDHMIGLQRQLEEQNYFLHHQHSYDIGGGDRRYDAIFLQMTPEERALPNGSRSIVFHGLTRTVMESRIGFAAIFAASALYHIQSYRPPTGSERLYDIIIRPQQRGWLIGRTGEQLAKDEGDNWAKGMRTRQVDRS